ncbi:hypothetical protein B0H16DRAFT_1297364, partial [Mycena metata]
KRSFTPTSDSENESRVIPGADDDTPPPEAPLIRQAVAFSWTPSIPTAPASINTYQASAIPTQQNFLPGQVVQAPPPPPPPLKRRGKSKKRSASQFSAQTGRFRLGDYDPTPASEPALTGGEGPYASMYRATPAASDNPAASTEGQASEAAPTGTRKSLRSKPSEPRSKPSEPKPKASTSKVKVNAKSSTSKSKASGSKRGASGTSTRMVQPEAGPSSGPHYRRDYVQGTEHARSSNAGSLSPRPDPRRLPGSVLCFLPLRLLTILIEDNRGDVTDCQLAEVHVRLRDNPDGFWANAEDICKALQSSPARIDGPAKIFVWRGKYRHTILKVTADNRDEWVPANVVVTPEKTLTMIVEGISPVAPASPVNPPRTPRGNTEPSFHVSPRAAPSAGYLGSNFGPTTNQELPSRKRQHSPDDYDGPRQSRQWSPSTLASSLHESPSRASTSTYQQSSSSSHHGAGNARMSIPDPQSSSLESEDPDSVHERVSEEVDQFIQTDRTWVDYFKLSGNPQRSAPNVLKEYEVVQGLVKNWVGTSVKSGAVIEKSHLARALKIHDDPAERDKYMSDCAETLQLMALYGAGGQRLQDPEVIQRASDETEPGYQMKPARALLKLLRRIDEQWVASHPADQWS